MGGAAKKLRAWCVHEFGKGYGDAPGNCSRCARFFKQIAETKAHAAIAQAELRGEDAPEEVIVDSATPCRQCPKFKLYDKWATERGLHPGNEMAVTLYRMCQEDQRVGLFDGAPLTRTLTIDGMCKMLDEFDEHFADSLDRQNCLQKMLLIDQIATEQRAAAEERIRQSKRQQRDAESRRGSGEIRGR